MDVKININTIQYDEHSKIDNINVNTAGTLHEKNNCTYLIYKESHEGVEVTTSIKIDGEEMTIKRFGASNSTMVFEKGKVNTTNYRTPYGLFNIETHTNHLNVIKHESGNMKIELDYKLKMNDFFNGRNKIVIDVEI